MATWSMELLAEGGIVLDSTWTLGVFGLLGTVVGGLFMRLMASKESEIKSRDAQIEELRAKNKALEAAVDESTGLVLGVANYYRTTFEKLPPIIPLAPVISNSNSPSTEKQRDEAKLETRKALLAAIRLATHQEPKLEPPQAIEPGVGTPSNAPSLPVISAEVKEHTKKLDEKVDEVAADVKLVRETTDDIKEVVDKATPKGRT